MIKDSNLSKLSILDRKLFVDRLSSYNMRYMDQLDLPINLTFGVEIEFQEANYKVINRELNKMLINGEITSKYSFGSDSSKFKWNLTTDQSVTFNLPEGRIGGEIVSPIMVNDQKCWEDLAKVCNMIVSNGGKLTGLAGSHIHIGSQVIHTKEQWLNLIKLWAAYENIIYKFSCGEDKNYRKGISYYAKPKRYDYLKKLSTLEKTTHDFRTKSYDIISKAREDRFDGLNLMEASSSNKVLDRNTIEVRTPNGTLNPVIWQNNINFFGRLTLYAGSIKYDSRKVSNRLQSLRKNVIQYHRYEASKSYVPEILSKYQNTDLDGAFELSDMIYDRQEDKANFLKQYIRSEKTRS